MKQMMRVTGKLWTHCVSRLELLVVGKKTQMTFSALVMIFMMMLFVQMQLL